MTISRSDYPPEFVKFVEDNPAIYWKFVKMALQMKRAGRRRYSAQTIIETIRWHTDLHERDGTFKINNNWSPYLARLAMAHKPELEGFFKIRERTK